MEVLHIEATHEDVPTVAYCQSNKDRAENREALNVSLPRLLDVRRCCPKNKVLDVRGKNCVSMTDVFPSENNSSNVHEFLSFLPKNLDTMDFLNVTRDRLKCSGALFTYEISAEDIVFEDGALKVSSLLYFKRNQNVRDDRDTVPFQCYWKFVLRELKFFQVCEETRRGSFIGTFI